MSRVLVVDDSKDSLLVIRSTLESAGYKVVTSFEPERALEIALTGTFDAIVLDIMMPGLSGLQILEQIRGKATSRTMPVLLLSALGDPSDRVRGIRLGADDYLVKPFEPTELAARIDRLVSRSKSNAEGLQGNLEDHSLAEISQNLANSQKTGVLVVSTETDSGTVVFSDGTLFRATYKSLSGGEAVLAMLELEKGNFVFRVGEVSDIQEIRSEAPLVLQSLLMENAWLQDELSERSKYLPASEARLTVGGKQLPSVPKGFGDLPVADVWRRIGDVPGTSVQDLVDLGIHSAVRTRLSVALLVELDGLAELNDDVHESLGLSEELDCAIREFLQEMLFSGPERPLVVLLSDGDQGESLTAILSRLPPELVPRDHDQAVVSNSERRDTRICCAGVDIVLRFGSIDRLDDAIGLPNASAVLVWPSPERSALFVRAAMARIEAEAPRHCGLVFVVDSDTALARLVKLLARDRWVLLTEPVTSPETLLVPLLNSTICRGNEN